MAEEYSIQVSNFIHKQMNDKNDVVHTVIEYYSVI